MEDPSAFAASAADSNGMESDYLPDISSLSMEIAVEVEKGAEIAQAGDRVGINSKGTKRFTKRDFVAKPGGRLVDARRAQGTPPKDLS